MNVRKFFILALSLLMPLEGFADYNANTSGVVTHVLTYTHTPLILFRLQNQPATHPTCQRDYFAIAPETPEAIRQQVLSRLLLAYSSGEEVNIGYDKDGSCADGRIRVYRVG